MKKQSDSLRVIYCIPGRQCPAQKTITAKVTDGKRTEWFTFGSDYSLRTIHEQVPRLWCDFYSKRRKKAVAR